MIGPTICVLVGGTVEQIRKYISQCNKIGDVTFSEDPGKLSDYLSSNKYIITTEDTYKKIEKTVQQLRTETVGIIFNPFKLSMLKERFDRLHIIGGI